MRARVLRGVPRGFHGGGGVNVAAGAVIIGIIIGGGATVSPHVSLPHGLGGPLDSLFGGHPPENLMKLQQVLHLGLLDCSLFSDLWKLTPP